METKFNEKNGLYSPLAVPDFVLLIVPSAFPRVPSPARPLRSDVVSVHPSSSLPYADPYRALKDIPILLSPTWYRFSFAAD